MAVPETIKRAQQALSDATLHATNLARCLEATRHETDSQLNEAPWVFMYARVVDEIERLADELETAIVRELS